NRGQSGGHARRVGALLRHSGRASCGSRDGRKKGDLEETRRIWVDLDNAEYIRHRLHLPGCQIALRVDRELRREDGQIVLHDPRYYVSSLDPDQITAADLLEYVRGHWRIENGLHFLKDRWWDED